MTVPPTQPEKHSHAGGVLALFLLVFGFGLGYFLSPVLAGLLGLLVLWMGWKFLKWRVDPLDMFFWMKSKPSWASVGLTWLSGLLLLGAAYATYILNHHSVIGWYLRLKGF